MMEFHISRNARDRYKFDKPLFSLDGRVIFANFHNARAFVHKINQKRDLVNFPEQSVRAGQVNALGLIDEIFHHVFSLYRQNHDPDALKRLISGLEAKYGKKPVHDLLNSFTVNFPPVRVYQKELSPVDYLQGSSEGVPHTEISLEEILMLRLTVINPAADHLRELFTDDELRSHKLYPLIMQEFQAYFEQQPKFGPQNQNLIDMLRTPAIQVPYSLQGQLEYIRLQWGELLGAYLYKLLGSLDLLKEEEKSPFLGAGSVQIPVYPSHTLNDPDAFSLDSEWMPRLVLLAKNIFVWMDQLSKTFQRNISRLDEVPDEELALLRKRGFNGLWLIGLWERSRASAQIKKMCGNPEAISSAYSLMGYEIAGDLGGEVAFNQFQSRASYYGIRLASDMVPNHMGIDSPWVIENPDSFLSLDYSPFPSYSFEGVNLSNDDRIGIYLEDHYYDRTDAAVVFKRVDFRSNQALYIYHGNDGTSMPWNDTAQLNYLNPEVREAVIQTILHVAKKFPIIRFDAAMTLAKRHYQRLWFPAPGTGGDIPSRAEHGMIDEQFNAAFPSEFWREVVDRCAMEAPDTLLLAEAFWLMEGYFVRTLGMHRVYNSAFMNLLRNEDNQQYRSVMKNTLEFEPEILKRFVNFMNNPDERTAVEQFGKGDKYFGICVMMVTLPGLPMFGHGQVEGFSEKYGMEYKRAYWDEPVDTYLIERHEREIFPLLHKRHLFADVKDFNLYNFIGHNGKIDENVYAYSNGTQDEKVLVIYNNKYKQTEGWVKNSVISGKKDKNGSHLLATQSLAETLCLIARNDQYVIFRDHITNMEYIYSAQEILQDGLYIQLGAYQYHVFLDFRTVIDDENQSCNNLCNYLMKRGVPSISEAQRELLLAPVQQPFGEIANSAYLRFLMENRKMVKDDPLQPHLLAEAGDKYEKLLNGIKLLKGGIGLGRSSLMDFPFMLESVLSLKNLDYRFPLSSLKAYSRPMGQFLKGLDDPRWLALISYCFVSDLGILPASDDREFKTQSLLDELQLGKLLSTSFIDYGLDTELSLHLAGIIRIIVRYRTWADRILNTTPLELLTDWLSDPDIHQFLGINRYQDVLWFNKESFEEFFWWITAAAILNIAGKKDVDSTSFLERSMNVFQAVQLFHYGQKRSGYQVNKLLIYLGNP